MDRFDFVLKKQVESNAKCRYIELYMSNIIYVL